MVKTWPRVKPLLLYLSRNKGQHRLNAKRDALILKRLNL